MNPTPRKSLSLPEKGYAAIAAALGAPFHEVAERLRLFDAAHAPASTPGRRRPFIDVVATEVAEVLQRSTRSTPSTSSPHLAGLLGTGIRSSRPSTLAWFILTALVALLVLGGEFAVGAVATADALGVDLSHGFEGVPAILVVLVFGTGLATTIAAVGAGGLVLAGPPIRRIGGALLLAVVSGALAIVRMQAADHAALSLGLLTFAVTFTAAVVAAQMKRAAIEALIAWLEARQGRQTEIEQAERALRAEEEHLEVQHRRRELAIEFEAVVTEPERHRVGSSARVAQARYWYRLGCWLVGRTVDSESLDAAE